MSDNDVQEYVTVTIAGQMFGIPVLQVHDVLGSLKLTNIPLAPPEVAGALNLRGRIVTCIDVRKRLGLPPADDNDSGMSVVVEHHGEPYSLLIDSVGEVLSLTADKLEQNPGTMDQRWREVSSGIYRTENELLVILQIERLLDFAVSSTAAA
ncbi:chemotaxis protein CheW [Sneathiella chinensis]|uniref:Chemotaxis protein CheW n=1 Tax=Sneathiella chinensis TaxID=349750 RepID=A0ABQ5U0Z9_9PROT|nr:chemotaxis protein CheW [Sneathiella chinensis]GLQ05835.1 chemotaxis protein CheW [Sneathiella chinensis]